MFKHCLVMLERPIKFNLLGDIKFSPNHWGRVCVLFNKPFGGINLLLLNYQILHPTPTVNFKLFLKYINTSLFVISVHRGTSLIFIYFNDMKHVVIQEGVCNHCFWWFLLGPLFLTNYTAMKHVAVSLLSSGCILLYESDAPVPWSYAAACTLDEKGKNNGRRCR